MKKSAQVVMLPTNEKTNIWLDNFGTGLYNSPTGATGVIYQHLYILSDEEIKEGDWYIDDCNLIRQFIISDKEYWEVRKDYKKIIATTDSSLVYNHKELHEVQAVIMESSYHKSLPQPSQDFLKVFVEEYNKGNVITEVMVEYDYDSYSTKADGKLTADFKLKINPKDNTININMPKDSWSREEVIELIQKYSKECTGWSWFETDEKWIEENL